MRSASTRPVAFTTARYIKLGSSGEWNDAALERRELHFGYRRVPHHLAETRDAHLIRQHLIVQGKKPSTAAGTARQVVDFYSLGAECLWITFARGHLWWAFAHPEVCWIDSPEPRMGDRTRKVIGQWRNTDLLNRLLHIDRLSTALTKVSAYRGSICAVADHIYLAHCINGTVSTEVAEARAARDLLVDCLSRAMARLKWQDFERLVDLMLTRGGWQRVSELGGAQADSDLIVEQPTTGERAFVQVKSVATAKVLADYIARYELTGSCQRLFFVCHTAAKDLVKSDRADIQVWQGRDLAERVLRAGLHDWLLDRVT